MSENSEEIKDWEERQFVRIEIDDPIRGREHKKFSDRYVPEIQERLRQEEACERHLDSTSSGVLDADAGHEDRDDIDLDDEELAKRYWNYAKRVANRYRRRYGRERNSIEHQEIEGDAFLGLAMGIKKFREAKKDSTQIIRGYIRIGVERGIQNRDPYTRRQRAKIEKGLLKEKKTHALEHEPYQERDTAQRKTNENLEAFFQMLSEDEVEVARLMALGLRYSAIAKKLDVSERTVERRVRQMRDHLTADKHTEWMAKNCLSQYTKKEMAV